MGFTEERPPTSSDSPLARTSNDRADISGEFIIRLPGGGQIWATEDAATVDPRIAVHANPVIAINNGRVVAPVEFFVYKNYDAFIDKVMIDVYDGANFDRLKPLVSLAVPDGDFVKVTWNGQAGRAIALGDEFYYRVRALDGNRRVDRTAEKTITAVSVNDVNTRSRKTLERAAGNGPDSARQTSASPLDDKVLVMVPPIETTRLETLSYTLTPRFDTRKTILMDNDKADLDRIIEQWRGATDVQLVSSGHTDHVRIAPEHRDEFANNQVLSVARAGAVAGYVAMRLGLRPDQIKVEGFGKTRPVATNKTAEGRAQNRRVELSITGNRVISEVTRQTAISLYDPASEKMVPVTGSLETAIAQMEKTAGMMTPLSTGGRAPASCMEMQSYGHELQAVYGSNELVERNIPIYGSRVRIHARDVAGSAALRINQHMVPIDTHGKFAVDYVMPVGSHKFNVEMLNTDCAVVESAKIPVKVSGKHMFIVALADLTATAGDLDGSLEPLAADDRYEENFLVEGRLAFYLKGKVRGKYLLTAQLDTEEEQLSNILEKLSDKDPRAIFRRLDPDRYYPVYGDDSTTIMDTDSIGKMYFRADWDNSRAVWGNFHTGFTGTELAQYNR
ncbi:MAG: OmpA family protein, partial [Gammaproteobacteria bacterium]|nr:OmpA family protein [Gammaproteobacteria bacterium]